MNADANIPIVQMASEELGELMHDLTLIGGCAASFLITDKARPPVRQTTDVDLMTEVATKLSYADLNEKLRKRGFVNDREIVCRYIKGVLIVDIVPVEEEVLKFTNSWYKPAVKHAVTSKLPNGKAIRHISAPYFIATKIESFQSRGNGDYAHHDIEDIINILDGRTELAEDFQRIDNELKVYLQEEFENLISDPAFIEHIPWHMHPDEANQARSTLVIRRLRNLVGL